MALSQFGGRAPAAGSGTATSGKEIGEVFLVPSSFDAPDVVQAGASVTNATYPDLFPKLVDGAAINNFVPANFPVTEASIGIRLLRGVMQGGVYYALTMDGKVISTADGNTWTAKGTLSISGLLPDAVLWPSDISMANRATTQMYSTGTRLIVINTMTNWCLGSYSDDNGVTWTTFNDSTINTVIAGVTATTPMSMFGGNGYAIMVDTTAKKIYRSTTGIGGWTDVTGTAVISATASSNLPATFVDSTLTMFWWSQTTCRSTDNGVTWTSVAFAPTALSRLSFIRWNGNMYALACLNATWTPYKSTDNAVTFAASGTAITAVTGAIGQFYVGSDGNLGIQGDRYVKSTDGVTWVLNASTNIINTANNNNFSNGYFMFANIPNGSGTKSVAINLLAGSTRQTLDYGTTWVYSNPVVTSSVAGIHYVDSATNDAGVTVVLTSSYIGTVERAALSEANLVGQNYMHTQSYYYGSFATGWTVGQMPVADIWTGITWNKYAGQFFATCQYSTSLYTSADGVNWTTIAAGSLPATIRSCAPRTFGIVTAFLPISTTSQVMVMAVGRGNGTYSLQKTAYSKVWPAAPGLNYLEFNQNWVINPSYLCLPNPNLISSSVAVSNPAAITATTFGTGDRGAVHNLTYVGKTNAGVYTVVTTNGTVATSTTPAASQTYADTGTLAGIWTKSGAIFAFVGDTQGGLRVRTTLDGGQNWSNGFISSIPTTEKIFYGKAFGNFVMLLGIQGTYMVDATGATSSATTKTLASGWVAPTGLKYVVKAK